MGRFFIHNFGCRATQADGAALETLLSNHGLEASSTAGGAEVVILNTCTVTAEADRDVRQAVRRVARENPRASILVTGCYAQRAPEELAALPGVRWVVGNSHKHSIPGILASSGGFPEESKPCHSRILVGDIAAQRHFLAAPVEEAGLDRTRPNLKIQDGCNHVCSFCIIPSVRGRSRSAPADDVIRQVRDLSLRYREIVLSGINLGRWGRDAVRPADGAGSTSRPRLVDLLRRLLAETPVERLRLSSLEPMDCSDELLELMAGEPRLARHLHAPLQSGCDSALRRMKRRYRRRHYQERILRARSLMPEAAIGADVMTGFPGETEEEFAESRRFIESLPFTYLHVFTYSERPGTPAAGLPGQVPVAVRKRRNAELRELVARKNLEFRRSFEGKRLSVVTLEDGWTGLSDNYLQVELAVRRAPNQIAGVEIARISPAGVSEKSPFQLFADIRV